MSEREVKFMESGIVQNAIIAFKGYGINANNSTVQVAMEIILEGASDLLRVTKSKQKTALLFNDQKGNMIAAAVVDYHENENEEGQDNYNYYWTFDKKDVEDEDVKRYEANQSQFQALLIQGCAERHGFELTEGLVSTMTSVMVSMLSDYLSENAKEGEEFKVTHEGYFTASSAVEDGEIVKSLIPDGPMKTLIKDDVTVEA